MFTVNAIPGIQTFFAVLQPIFGNLITMSAIIMNFYDLGKYQKDIHAGGGGQKV